MNTAIDRLQPLSTDQLNKVHSATIDILGTTGMCFESEEVREIFRKNDFKLEGKNVLFTEAQIRTAVESVAKKWTLMARDPEKIVKMNIDSYSIGMGGGSPFMINADSSHHPATRMDYINSLKKCAREIARLRLPQTGILQFGNDPKTIHIFPYLQSDCLKTPSIRVVLGESGDREKH